MTDAAPPSGAPLPPLRDVIARHDLGAKKSLGQNFLLDLNLTGRIARAAGPLQDCTVYEVGPGPGGLTRALLDAGAARVVAVERDCRCLAALAEVSEAYPGRLTVIAADALDASEASLLPAGPTRIVANLPYNIATALLVKWVGGPDWPPFWQSLTLMFQKEVAERIVAAPRGKAYGRLSVLVQARCQARILFDVGAKNFVPPPKVTSAIVHLLPLPNPPLRAPMGALEKLTAAAFGQRRKMLRQSLKSVWPQPDPVLEQAGIAPTARAEELTVEDFCRLAERL